MKFTKLTSSVLAGATLLSLVAPAATFAATAENSTVANGGTALPMDGGHDTKVGISFGENNPNGKTGYLRLQYVPYTLDFGNHKLAGTNFDANGLDTDNAENNVSVGYTGSENTKATNKTDTFNSDVSDLSAFNPSDASETATNKHAWATVVDKQQDATSAEETAAGADGKNGTWELKVKSNASLTGTKTTGASNGVIAGAVLKLDKTEYANTQDVFGLTGEKQDNGYTLGTGTTGSITPESSVTLNLDDTKAYQTVATVGADMGAGANVFAWNHDNITLTLPANSAVQNDVYTTNLSWQLSTGVTAPTQP
ncbi:WxL domain-containing protein [Latilactobacillus fuchuensis]|uniref:WxL domain-containing protein n=1 Tax=Latilactobacillus fuchuensis DSM 14340 = JCM 11249 TaxID=1423747 RepID=A0A0R1S171_9LACO|nr:WxL domain-containing protein [Latilactobacillus fuchuensis]KRL59163.1 hypothetical protein FC69_GL001789 [Latilactobacillus fuchuensis DSM 14340 = JCM 11249]